jgi:Squalene-hopene cyclase C-terminal domain/Prenyltransferase and squalene oxidase repeat
MAGSSVANARERLLPALPYDPVPALLASDDAAVTARVRRDLLGEDVDVRALWSLPAVTRAVRRQLPDGRFQYPGGGIERWRAIEDYDQRETYTVLLELVSKYALTGEHPMISQAADFLSTRQTADGDFRGIYGAQYTPNYSAAILSLLVQAGFDDSRVDRSFDWLLSIRQDDGGWAIPARTIGSGSTLDVILPAPQPIEPDRSRPSSHLITGIVLRAFAAHPVWRDSPAAHAAGNLLASRFFHPDSYVDRRAASYWEKLAYPFHWTDILSSLDSLSQLGISRDNSDVQRAVTWLVSQQRPDGLWRCGYQHAKDPSVHRWVTFAACRALARLLV